LGLGFNNLFVTQIVWNVYGWLRPVTRSPRRLFPSHDCEVKAGLWS